MRGSAGIFLTAVCGSLMQAANAEELKIAVDILPIQALVASVTEGVIDPPALIVAANASPHGYSMKPSQAAYLAEADLVVWIGPELTPWLDESIESLAGSAKSLALLETDGLDLMDVRDAEDFELNRLGDDHDDHGHQETGHKDDHDDHAHEEAGHKDDHDDHGHEEAGHKDDHDDHGHEETGHKDDHDDHGHEEAGQKDDHDDHGHEGHAHAHFGTDAHAWLDPEIAKVWLDTIATTLGEFDPDNAERFQANADAAKSEIDVTKSEAEALLEPLHKKPFFVYHDAYQYFERAFELEAAGTLSDGLEIGSRPARLAAVQEFAEHNQIGCVFSEPQFDYGLVASVFGDDFKVTVIDPLVPTSSGSEMSYPMLIKDVAVAFADCLSGGGS